MKFSIHDILALTTLIAMICALAAVAPAIFLGLMVLMHLFQIVYVAFMVLMAILFAEARNGYLDITQDKNFRHLNRIFGLSFIVTITSWIGFGMIISRL